MDPDVTFEELTLTGQVVLLGIADSHREAETPVQTHKIRRTCKHRLERVETGVVGTITEADVMRSLYRLEDAGLVTEVDPDETSPTGKGRPAYTLAVDPETVSERVDDELVPDDDRE